MYANGGWGGDYSSQFGPLDLFGIAPSLLNWQLRQAEADAEARFETPETTTQYWFTDANGNTISNQKTLAATAFGQRACSGMDDDDTASCIQQTYDSMGDSVKSEGGHDNFDYSKISIVINGENIDTNPADFGCLGGRCGIFNSMDFSHPGTTFHVDMANVYFFPVGTLIHTMADLWGGHSWWSAGVPPFPFP